MPKDDDKEEMMALTGSAMFAGKMAVIEELDKEKVDKQRFDMNLINQAMEVMNKNKGIVSEENDKSVSSISKGIGAIGKSYSGHRLQLVSSHKSIVTENSKPNKDETPIQKDTEVINDVSDKSKDIEVLINSFLYDKDGNFVLIKKPFPSYYDDFMKSTRDAIYLDLKTLRVVRENKSYYVVTDDLYLENKIDTTEELRAVIDRILIQFDLPSAYKKLLLNIPALFILIK